MRNKKLLEFGVGLLLLVLLSCLAATRVLDSFENIFLDLRFQLRPERSFPPQLAVVGIDEASLDVFGRWPWPRDKHATLLGLLRHESFRPSVIGLDMLFEEKDAGLPGGDDNLVYNIKSLDGRVISAYFFEKGYVSKYERDEAKEKRLEEFAITDSSAPPEHLDEADKVSIPFMELAAVSDLAFVNTPPDEDGRTRRAQLLMRYKGKIYPSMDLLMVLRYLGAEIEDIQLEGRAIVIESPKIGKRVIPVNARGEMLINYYGNLTDIKKFSFVNLFEDGSGWMKGGPAELLRGLKDKIVMVGVTALGIGDRRVTPFHRYEVGVSLHTQVMANILDQNYLVRAPVWISLLAMFLTGFAAILITMFLRITKSLPAVLGLGLLYFFVAQAMFQRGLWIDVAAEELGMAVLFVGITSFRYFTALEELKRMQDQLIQSVKMASLGQLSAGIAHEFRNILNAINLHVEYCSLPNSPPERVTKYMAVVKQVITNANLILNGLLTFARKSESVKKPGDLKKTVENTLLLVQKEMMAHQIEVQTELEEVPEISYDEGQISQVVMNLMNNARDALKDREGKVITLRVKPDSAGVLLEIEDNGSGIPPQVLKRLFEPFVTSKPAGKGTGLGLSVCHGIIRNHNGSITVTTAQGKGTTWHIFLPK